MHQYAHPFDRRLTRGFNKLEIGTVEASSQRDSMSRFKNGGGAEVGR